MLVETFEVENLSIEKKDEFDQEQIKLIESLELDGQKDFINENEDGDKETIPYRKWTKDEQFVYSILCPKRTELRKYNGSPIPLRVLQVIAHAKSIGLNDLYVLSTDSAIVLDPILINGKGEDALILARWGDELEEFSILLKKAVTKFKETGITTIKKKINELKQKINEFNENNSLSDFSDYFSHYNSYNYNGSFNWSSLT